MAIRSRFYLHLAVALNCLILAFLIFDSRAINSLDINVGLFPDRWGQDGRGWFNSAMGGMKERQVRCGMCRGNMTLCNELGEKKLDQAVWFAGSGQRMKRFLAKASQGNGFTVSVVGGSVSKGHGLGFNGEWDEPETPLNMNRRIFDHLDTMFPATGGAVIGEAGGKGKNGFVNGAQGGMGTSYFALCFGEHIPDNTDLILIDMSINDELHLVNMDSYELLLRGLLDMPSKPAIINIHIFALMYGQLALGGDLHAGLNQFYDIPTFSLRGPYLHEALLDTSVVQELFHVKGDPIPGDLSNVDLRHHSATGHRRIAEFVNAYINWQFCEVLHTPRQADLDHIEDLPRQMLMQPYSKDTVIPPLKPMCMSTASLKHPLKATESQGWFVNFTCALFGRYIRATKPGSTISFDVQTSLGSIQIHYLKSAIFGLGNLKCWVDDDVDKAVIIEAYWTEKTNIGKGTTVRDDLQPGAHTLKCELLEKTADPGGGTEFRIVSVMS